MGSLALAATAHMGFTRLVENGRICLVNFGPDAGKLVVIVDVIDHNRALVFGPTNGVARQILTYKRMSLTDIKIPLGRGARCGTVTKAWAAANVEEQWAATSWGKKLAARKAKACSSDFERFATFKNKQKINRAARAKVDAN